MITLAVFLLFNLFVPSCADVDDSFLTGGRLKAPVLLSDDRIIIDGVTKPFTVEMPAGTVTHDVSTGEWTAEATSIIRSAADEFCVANSLMESTGGACPQSLVDQLQNRDQVFGERWGDSSIAGDLSDPADDTHRHRVGGNFDAGGQYQLDIMLKDGLRPHHKVLDVACGSLRGGVKMVPYLDPGNYYGVDINEALLVAGYEKEIVPRGLASRLPRENLLVTANFDFRPFGLPGGANSGGGANGGGDGDIRFVNFDFVMIQSLFTHISLEGIEECLAKLSPYMRPGGLVFATLNALPHFADRARPLPSPGTFEFTYHDRDQYHHAFTDLLPVATRHGYEAVYVGNWGHEMESHDSDDYPSMNKLVKFVRKLVAPTPTAPGVQARMPPIGLGHRKEV
eukprot:g418.t1